MLDLKEYIARKQKNNFNLPFKTKKTGLWALFVLVILLNGFLGYRLVKLEKKYRKNKAAQKEFFYDVTSEFACINGVKSPALTHIPYADDLGIITEVKTVSINEIPAPYNPSLIQTKEGFDLLFRYDTLSSHAHGASFLTNIGVAHLDHQFEQVGDYKQLDLKSDYTDDPRTVFADNKLYLFYNALDPQDNHRRPMCLANLDPVTYDVNYITELDMNLYMTEKNWCPFELISDDGVSHLMIEYMQMNPRKILELPDTKINDLKNITVPKDVAFSRIQWAHNWGRIRGGTPAVKIGDEYLSFFHSSYQEKNGMYWYVMGAYTFNAKYPFEITKISHYPILFKDIYNTPIIHTADIYKRVIFPSGLVVDGDKVYLACGSNDCAVKILTFDKEKLLKSMSKIKTK